MKKSKLIKVTRYNVLFKTADGKEHIDSSYNYVNTNLLKDNILHSILLLGQNFMIDDDGIFYPMSNVLEIKTVEVETKYVIARRGYSIWYGKEDILDDKTVNDILEMEK